MENVLSIMSNADNVRLLVFMASVFCSYLLLNNKMGRLEYSLNKRIDELDFRLNKRIDEVSLNLNKRIDDLKFNDFAHLNSTIEALTYALEKNGSLKKEDKDYIDSRLAH